MGQILVASALLWAAPAAAQLRSVTVQPPSRDFGYVVGDLFTSTVRITAARGTVLDGASVPPVGAVTGSLDVRRVEVARSEAADGTRFVIRLTYQTFFAPLEVGRQVIPGFSVDFIVAGRRVEAGVGGFAIAVSPFRHDLQPVTEVAAMRADHAIGGVSESAPVRLIWAGGIIAVLGGALLLATLPRRRTGPFAQAARRIRTLAGADRREALLALHRAFDATAGQRVFADDLERFIADRKEYTPLRDDLARFFAESRAAFFGPSAAEPSDGWLERLSRALARAERTG